MNPIVDIEQGQLMGRKCVDYEGNDYFSFQGIPYARPPVGELRFKAPEPADGWKGIRQATQCTSESLQKKTRQIGSEDCLYLNVYTPRLPCCAKCRLPVMVYIHGGGFLEGTGNDYMCGPDFIQTEMVVLVTFNYRLGILGFLSLQDQSLEVPGNAAFKDCVMCLKWVRKNITHFNGDLKNVTVFGGSAGGLAVHLLMLSPMARGLFHKAIIQSASVFCPWAMIKNNMAYEAAAATGYSGGESNEAEILKHLQSLSEEDLLTGQEAVSDNLFPSENRAFGPVVEYESDDAFLTEPPLYILASNSYHKIPTMIGYTNKEGLWWAKMVEKKGDDLEFPLDLQTLIPSYYNVQHDTTLSLRIADMLKKYYCNGVDPTDKNMEDLYILNTDVMFWRGIYLAVKSQASSIPLYLYRFSMDGELNLSKIDTGINSAGASHSDDFHYLFKSKRTPGIERNSPTEMTLFRMVKLWTTFARQGNPIPAKGDPLIPVKWEKVNPGCIKCLNIDEQLTFDSNPDLARMEIWDKISEYIAHNHANQAKSGDA